jgi:hypothetical protein
MKREESNGETPVDLKGSEEARSKAEKAIMDIIEEGKSCTSTCT